MPDERKPDAPTPEAPAGGADTAGPVPERSSGLTEREEVIATDDRAMPAPEPSGEQMPD